MTNAPAICNCCEEPVQGEVFASVGIGMVCRECARNLRQGIGELEKKGMRGVFTGPCPDHPEGGKP